MTDIYSGVGWLGKSQVGQCGNGDIYSGYGWGKTQVGSYQDGDVYSGHGWGKTQIGSYRNGEVYSGYGWGKTQVGSYKDGCIYSGYGWGKTQIGSYEGPDDGAAAAALLIYCDRMNLLYGASSFPADFAQQVHSESNRQFVHRLRNQVFSTEILSEPMANYFRHLFDIIDSRQ